MTIPTSSASQSGEAVQASSAQDEPNYKALYTELKGEREEAQALAYATTETMRGLEAYIMDRRDNDEGKGTGPWAEGIRYLADKVLHIIQIDRADIPRQGQQIYAATQARAQRAESRAQAAEQALSELKREVLEGVEPFAAKLADIGEDEADDDAFRDMSPANRRAPRITVGHFRALSSLHEKLSSIGEASRDQSPTTCRGDECPLATENARLRRALEKIVALFRFEYPVPLQAEAVAKEAIGDAAEPPPCIVCGAAVDEACAGNWPARPCPRHDPNPSARGEL